MRKYLINTIILSSFLTLSGCATFTPSSAIMEKITNQQIEIEQLKIRQKELQNQLDTWQEIEPNIQRLVIMEDELKTLIEQQKVLLERTNIEATKQLKARPAFIL